MPPVTDLNFSDLDASRVGASNSGPVFAAQIGAPGTTNGALNALTEIAVTVGGDTMLLVSIGPAAPTLAVDDTQVFTVTISPAQFVDVVIDVATSDDSVLSIDADQVTIDAGDTTATFTGTALTEGNAVVSAFLNGVTRTSNVTVAPSSYELIIAANTADYNVRTAFIAAFGAPPADVDLTVTVNPGVIVSASSTSTAALTWDTPWTGAPVFTLANGGSIIGCDGDGGAGGNNSNLDGGNGTDGGNAIDLSGNTVTRTPAGTVTAGRGGGGGGGGGYTRTDTGSVTPGDLEFTQAFGAGGGGVGLTGGAAGTGSFGLCKNVAAAPSQTSGVGTVAVGNGATETYNSASTAGTSTVAGVGASVTGTSNGLGGAGGAVGVAGTNGTGATIAGNGGAPGADGIAVNP